MNTIKYPGTTRQTTTGLYGSQFQKAGGHELFRYKNDVSNSQRIDGRTEWAGANFLLREHPGSINDPYLGYVDLLVIAETV